MLFQQRLYFDFAMSHLEYAGVSGEQVSDGVEMEAFCYQTAVSRSQFGCMSREGIIMLISLSSVSC